MAITQETKPYEFLIRWNAQGEIQGMHVGFYDIIKKDGVIAGPPTTRLESVAVGEAQGFPLNDALTFVNASLALENENLIADNTVLAAQVEALQSANTLQAVEIERLNAIFGISNAQID